MTAKHARHDMRKDKNFKGSDSSELTAQSLYCDNSKGGNPRIVTPEGVAEANMIYSSSLLSTPLRDFDPNAMTPQNKIRRRSGKPGQNVTGNATS